LPFLEKGQIYRYCFNIDGLTYVSMSEYQSLKKYYSATPKVLIRRIVNRQNKLMAMYYDKELVFTKDINPFLISKKYNLFYILAIINSKIISYLYINTSSIATKDDFRQTTLAELRNLPIPDCKSHIQDKIGRIAERLIDLHKKLTEAKDPCTLEQLQRRINATDRKIDQLVYELYGLTEEEIEVVEEGVG